MNAYVVRHPRTSMFLAKKERPRNVRMSAGFGQDYKWVRTLSEATAFGCYADAELPVIFLNLAAADICPLLSRGLAGDPIDRDTAMANGSFHSTDLSRARGSHDQ